MQQFFISVLLKVLASEQVQTQLDKWKDQIIATITDQLKDWLPVIVKTVVTGIAQSAGQLVVNTTDKVTDIIPGHIDDDVIDPIVTNVLDKLGELLPGIRF